MNDSIGAERAVTVLLPHRGCEDLLGQAIDSILMQTMSDFALVVVDDASDDPARFLQVVRAHSDPRLHVFRTTRRAGQFRIYNRLLPRIASPLVALQDADDRSERDRLEVLIDGLTRLRADIVGSHLLAEDTLGESCVLQPPEDVNRALRWRCRGGVLFGATSLARAEFLRTLGGWDGTTIFGADSDLAYRAVFRGRVANIARPLYRYTLRVDSLMRAEGTGDRSAVRRAYRRRIRRRFYRHRLLQIAGRLGDDDLLAEPNDVDFDVVATE